jgi:hypothetical protein
MDSLRDRGYLVGSVERRKKFPDKKKHKCNACGNIPMVEISSDLWEIFDLIAIHPLETRQVGSTCYRHKSPIVFVQTTDRSNHSHRRNKILGSMEAKLVLLSGAKILVQSWSQEAGHGSRWQCFDEWITLDMYKEAPHYPNTVAELMEIKRKAKLPDLPPGTELFYSAIKDEEIPF